MRTIILSLQGLSLLPHLTSLLSLEGSCPDYSHLEFKSSPRNFWRDTSIQYKTQV
jgi:hypothetical protein